MAYFSIRPCLIFSLVILSLLLATPSFASKVVDVNVICAQTRDPSFCSEVLNSKPGGAKGADLISLAQHSIGVARVKATKTVNLINTLIATNANDPRAKAHYSTCLTYFDKYRGALKLLYYVNQVLRMQDYFGLLKAATLVISNVEGCITGDDPTYFDSSDLPRSADNFEKVIDVILTIAKFLINK
ncbi:hypothetical protein TanjilG_11783 [Lupinus angustifolius]|uniref:Pectinesterase inhibitor domain-containing protein n=1 Tax=Lupinus angustifolius TaxID=3871 RepID=A0A4P1R6E4_LUPAN|nr:PREDICTED: pectinesterase inhibitor-like [Lupinus angustifolius]OIW03146.1 hypothetical protein TanjilG_11783 [Lupinus angustifolius]